MPDAVWSELIHGAISPITGNLQGILQGNFAVSANNGKDCRLGIQPFCVIGEFFLSVRRQNMTKKHPKGSWTNRKTLPSMIFLITILAEWHHSLRSLTIPGCSLETRSQIKRPRAQGEAIDLELADK